MAQLGVDILPKVAVSARRRYALTTDKLLCFSAAAARSLLM
jgi:hypothetical protein